MRHGGDCNDSSQMTEAQQVAQLESDIEALQTQIEEKQAKLDAYYTINIKDCDNIEVKKEEHKELLEDLKKFCKQDPNSFFAQLDINGNLTFLLKFTQADKKFFSFAAAGDVAFKYKGHELIVKGKYDYSSAGSSDDGDLETIQNIAGSTEYNIDVAKTNLSAFAKLAHETQMVKKVPGTNNTHATTGTVGLKYTIFETEAGSNLSAASGFGFTHNAYSGSLATLDDKTSPVVTGNLSYTQVIVEDKLKANAGVGVTQSLTGEHYTEVDWNVGVDANIWGGFGIGAKYEGTYNENIGAAGNAPLTHTVMGTLSFSLDPDSWKSKKEKEKKKKAKKLYEQWQESQNREPANH